MTQHLAGRLDDLVDRPRQAPAALALGILLEVTGTAPTGMDLRFHDPDGTAELLGNAARLLRRVGDPAARNGDPQLLEQSLRLVLIHLHRPPCPLPPCPCPPPRLNTPPPPP